MKILFLTQYYPPEVGAPQNRLHELILRLKSPECQIDVFTAMPNYPQMEIHPEYKGKLYALDELDGVKIHRSFIYVSKSKSVFPRLLNYFSFVFSSLFFGLIKLPRYDYIFCESPPLFLGISAWILCKFKNSRLIFNVSDLWPESAEKLGIISNSFLIDTARSLEEFLYKSAVLITGQTQGIVKNIKGRFPMKKVYWLPNGVDLSYYNPGKYDRKWREIMGFGKDDILLAYAGILGHAQGLEVILKAAALLRDNVRLKFIFLGSGPEKPTLQKLSEDLSLKNIFFMDVISKKDMPFFVSAIDISIIPLKNITLFEGAIPSKIFENLAMEKPVLLGLKGEAKELFIDEGKAGLAFTPEDELSLRDKIIEMTADPLKLTQFGKNGRSYVEKNFDRNNIAQMFKTEIENLQ